MSHYAPAFTGSGSLTGSVAGSRIGSGTVWGVRTTLTRFPLPGRPMRWILPAAAGDYSAGSALSVSSVSPRRITPAA